MRRVLTVALLCWGAVSAVAAGELEHARAAIDLDETRWLSPDADAVAALTKTPGECLRPADDKDAAYLVEVGRAAFNNPLLFGGLAARGGLSCNSCHRDGRDNPNFFAEGLSRAPGTADVTSALFSKVREDGVFNPLPIPSLVDIAGKKSFGTRAPAESLHSFIESAIVEEFQGAPPPAQLVDAIAVYVANLDSAYCPANEIAQNVERAVDDIERILKAAADAVRRGDIDIAGFLILSAQQDAGAIHDRFASDGLGRERALLAGLSASLAATRNLVVANAPDAADALEAINTELGAVAPALQRRQAQSLYDPQTLEQRLLFAPARPVQ